MLRGQPWRHDAMPRKHVVTHGLVAPWAYVGRISQAVPPHADKQCPKTDAGSVVPLGTSDEAVRAHDGAQEVQEVHRHCRPVDLRTRA